MKTKELFNLIVSNSHLDYEIREGFGETYAEIRLCDDIVYVQALYDGNVHAKERCPGSNTTYLTGTSWEGRIHISELPVEARLSVIKNPFQIYDIEANRSGFRTKFEYEIQ